MTTLASANVFKDLPDGKAAGVLSLVLRQKPDLGALQEWARGRDRLFAPYHPRYKYARGPHGGGPVFYTSRYSLVSVRSVVLSQRSFVGHLAGRRSTLAPTVATEAVLHDDKTGHDVTVINYHLTAEVQANSKYRTDLEHRARVRRHKHEARRLAARCRHHRRKGRVVYAIGDTNFAGLVLAGMTSCWKGRRGHTLGSRAVDVIFADGPALHVHTIPTASDHDAVIAVYKEH